MAIPEGYTELGRIGFVDKGNYSATTTYRIGDVVYYNGSTWSALKDNLKGVTPSPGVNWKYMARGFAAELLADVTAKDTSGVLGTAGANVTSQALIDDIADRVMTKLFAKANVVNNLLTTEAGYALDARQGKALKTLIDNTNSDFTAELNTKFNKSEISAGSLVPGGNITFPYGAPKWYKIGRVMCISGIFSSSAADAEIASLTPALGPYGSMVLHFRAELFSGSSAAADAVKISITKSAQKTGINVVGATAGRHYSLSVAYVTD